jgi:hypothetical protein
MAKAKYKAFCVLGEAFFLVGNKTRKSNTAPVKKYS